MSRSKQEEHAADSRLHPWCLIVIGAVTLGATAVIAAEVWMIGIPGQWEWPYYKDPNSWVLGTPPFILSLILATLVGISLRRRFETIQQEVVVVCLCMAISLGIILSLGDAANVGDFESVPRIGSNVINGYYAEAVNVEDMGEYLKRYPERIAGLSVQGPFGHVSDHPVGPVFFHWFVNRTLEATPSLAHRFIPSNSDKRFVAQRLLESPACAGGPVTEGELAGIWASALLFRLAFWLALVFVYLIGRELHSPEAGLLALALAALIPSCHLFGPYPDQVFPLLAAGSFYCWVRALRKKNLWWAGGAALLVVAGLTWTLAFLAMIAVMGLAAVLTMWKEWVTDSDNGNYSGWCRVGMGAAVGFVLASLLPEVLFGYDMIGVWKICYQQHASFAPLFMRSYGSWTLFNPVEFILFAGVPLSLLMALLAAFDLRRWWREKRHAALPLLPWTLIGVLAVLNLSGKNLGEVGRLWMFLMPLAAVSAGAALDRLDGRRGWVAVCLVVLSGVQLVVFRLHIDALTLNF